MHSRNAFVIPTLIQALTLFGFLLSTHSIVIFKDALDIYEVSSAYEPAEAEKQIATGGLSLRGLKGLYDVSDIRGDPQAIRALALEEYRKWLKKNKGVKVTVEELDAGTMEHIDRLDVGSEGWKEAQEKMDADWEDEPVVVYWRNVIRVWRQPAYNKNVLEIYEVAGPWDSSLAVPIAQKTYYKGSSVSWVLYALDEYAEHLTQRGETDVEKIALDARFMGSEFVPDAEAQKVNSPTALQKEQSERHGDTDEKPEAASQGYFLNKIAVWKKERVDLLAVYVKAEPNHAPKTRTRLPGGPILPRRGGYFYGGSPELSDDERTTLALEEYVKWLEEGEKRSDVAVEYLGVRYVSSEILERELSSPTVPTKNRLRRKSTVLRKRADSSNTKPASIRDDASSLGERTSLENPPATTYHVHEIAVWEKQYERRLDIYYHYSEEASWSDTGRARFEEWVRLGAAGEEKDVNDTGGYFDGNQQSDSERKDKAIEVYTKWLAKNYGHAVTILEQIHAELIGPELVVRIMKTTEDESETRKVETTGSGDVGARLDPKNESDYLVYTIFLKRRKIANMSLKDPYKEVQDLYVGESAPSEGKLWRRLSGQSPRLSVGGEEGFYEGGDGGQANPSARMAEYKKWLAEKSTFQQCSSRLVVHVMGPELVPLTDEEKSAQNDAMAATDGTGLGITTAPRYNAYKLYTVFLWQQRYKEVMGIWYMDEADPHGVMGQPVRLSTGDESVNGESGYFCGVYENKERRRAAAVVEYVKSSGKWRAPSESDHPAHKKPAPSKSSRATRESSESKDRANKKPASAKRGKTTREASMSKDSARKKPTPTSHDAPTKADPSEFYDGTELVAGWVRVEEVPVDVTTDEGRKAAEAGFRGYRLYQILVRNRAYKNVLEIHYQSAPGTAPMLIGGPMRVNMRTGYYECGPNCGSEWERAAIKAVKEFGIIVQEPHGLEARLESSDIVEKQPETNVEDVSGKEKSALGAYKIYRVRVSAQKRREGGG